jgi:gas vesicle protein
MEFNDNSDTLLAFLAGVAVGAAAMFIFDPQQGRRRRALARDQLVRAGHQTADFVEGKSKDLRNRAQGVAAETRGAVRGLVGNPQESGQP